MKAKTPRIIRVSHPQLRHFRAAMCLVLRATVEVKLRELDKKYAELELNTYLPDKERISKKKEIMREISYYSFVRARYPLGCSFCGDRAVGEDLIYNPAMDMWYCEEHYAELQDYYKKNPSSSGLDWRKLYPPLSSEK